mmetsp:Transcript_5324/g.13116  ORF Transcript_5324/g.13116 Transcript_5324/m.13116 type:complete len:410 (+) Transcript_5324:1207-2436(+)
MKWMMKRPGPTNMFTTNNVQHSMPPPLCAPDPYYPLAWPTPSLATTSKRQPCCLHSARSMAHAAATVPQFAPKFTAATQSSRRASRPVPEELQRGGEGVVDGLGQCGHHAQVHHDPVRTADARHGDRVDALAGEGRVSHAVQALYGGAVEGHAHDAHRPARRDGAVRALGPPQVAAVRAWRADLLELDGVAQAGRAQRPLQACDDRVSRRLLARLILSRVQPLPGVHEISGEGVHHVAAGWRHRGIDDGGHGHKHQAVGVLQLLPVLQNDVVHVQTIPTVGQRVRAHTQVQREEGRRLAVALPEQALRGGHALLAHHALKRVPARGVGDERLAAEHAPVRQPHAHRLHAVTLALRQDLLDARLVHDRAAVLHHALRQRLGDLAHAAPGVVDVAKEAVRQHHASIDHGRV